MHSGKGCKEGEVVLPGRGVVAMSGETILTRLPSQIGSVWMGLDLNHSKTETLVVYRPADTYPNRG